MKSSINVLVDLEPGDIIVVGPKGKFFLGHDGKSLHMDFSKIIVLKQPVEGDATVALYARKLVDTVWEELFYDTGEMKTPNLY